MIFDDAPRALVGVVLLSLFCLGSAADEDDAEMGDTYDLRVLMKRRVVQEPSATPPASAEPEAAPTEARLPPKGLSWDGPIGVINRFGSPCSGPGARPSLEVLQELTQGLPPGGGYHQIGYRPGPVQLRVRCALEPWPEYGHGADVPPEEREQPYVWQVDGDFIHMALPDGLFTGASDVRISGGASFPIAHCDPKAAADLARCTREEPETWGDDEWPCVANCYEQTLGPKSPLAGWRLQRLEVQQADYFECTGGIYPSELRVRVLPPGVNAAAWLPIQQLLNGGAGRVEAWFAGPGEQMRALVLEEDNCSDDYSVQVVRWSKDGHMTKGRRFSGAPSAGPSEICSQ